MPHLILTRTSLFPRLVHLMGRENRKMISSGQHGRLVRAWSTACFVWGILLPLHKSMLFRQSFWSYQYLFSSIRICVFPTLLLSVLLSFPSLPSFPPSPSIHPSIQTYISEISRQCVCFKQIFSFFFSWWLFKIFVIFWWVTIPIYTNWNESFHNVVNYWLHSFSNVLWFGISINNQSEIVHLIDYCRILI